MPWQSEDGPLRTWPPLCSGTSLSNLCPSPCLSYLHSFSAGMPGATQRIWIDMRCVHIMHMSCADMWALCLTSQVIVYPNIWACVFEVRIFGLYVIHSIRKHISVWDPDVSILWNASNISASLCHVWTWLYQNTYERVSHITISFSKWRIVF